MICSDAAPIVAGVSDKVLVAMPYKVQLWSWGLNRTLTKLIAGIKAEFPDMNRSGFESFQCRDLSADTIIEGEQSGGSRESLKRFFQH